MSDDLRDMLRNVTAAHETERAEAAERDKGAFDLLERSLLDVHAAAAERETALLDVIEECRAGIMAVLLMDEPHHELEKACPLKIRTIAARAEEMLRLAGRA